MTPSRLITANLRTLLIRLICVFVFVWLSYLIYDQANSNSNPMGHESTRNVLITSKLDSNSRKLVTEPVDSDRRLLFNRVPKCGSTSLIAIIRKLSKLNNFKHVSSKIYDQRLLTSHMQEQYVKTVLGYSEATSFDRHVFFINFNTFQANSNPMYINMVRDPIERIISSYFYRRAVANKSSTAGAWLNKNFDSCVSSDDQECSYITGHNYTTLLVPYFCGHDPRCVQLNSHWAVGQAKRNIDQYYSVVGVLEQFNRSLHVLENTVPRYFTNLGQMYALNVNSMLKNKNSAKRRVSDASRHLLRVKLSADYDLYEYIKTRLLNQYQRLTSI